MAAGGNTSQPVEASKIRNDRMKGEEPEGRTGILKEEQVCSKNGKVFLGCKSWMMQSLEMSSKIFFLQTQQMHQLD